MCSLWKAQDGIRTLSVFIETEIESVYSELFIIKTNAHEELSHHKLRWYWKIRK